MRNRSINRLAIRGAGMGAALLALALGGCKGPDTQTVPTETAQPQLGLLTTLPILWAEGDVGTLLSGENTGSWVKEQLDARFQPVPIDRLTQLDDQRYLLMAQPRALAGDENVALDDWVRGGGHLLLLADPMLTAHSDYGLGDARAPQPVALVSPILARWGLELVFDPAQSPDERVSAGPLALPTRMAGSLRLTGKGHESRCELSENALVAQCEVGEGRVTVVADAALVEDADHPSESASDALDRLLDAAFGSASG
ncbi:DUF4350 domain-containing protein [Croceicoccus marinus]|uniref:ABC transporter n=1 Tax=Croceicoccus marinus TaxID=450378 RepID=A0A7G6VWD3_9SPHN|nr:DUF4350 domain-containing protein [Croceicoccus marinus]QNE06048.1 ABC transporter [Croceicoccus marinus]